MGAPAPAPGRVEITDTAHVELLVRRFYQAVIPDPLLGPIFRAMDVDWSVHIPKLVAFWAGRLLGQRGYEGNVVGAHQPVLDRSLFGDAELARWLELWVETVDELFVGDVAETAKRRAHMAGSAIGALARRHSAARAGRRPGIMATGVRARAATPGSRSLRAG